MTLTAPQQDPSEQQLQAVLRDLPEPLAVPARGLAHAWVAAGGTIQVGRHTIRLLAPHSPGGTPLTAGVVHLGRESGRPPRLEICRARVVGHGVDAVDWAHWAGDLLDLQEHGFDPTVKYTHIPLDPPLPPAALAQLVGGLRDLAILFRGA